MMVNFPIVSAENYSEKAVKVALEGNGGNLTYVFLPKKCTKPYGKILEDGTKIIQSVDIPYWLADKNNLLAKNWNGTDVFLHTFK